eukprot:jgi/Galph1/5999/GphlegSOOS_G4577.1
MRSFFTKIYATILTCLLITSLVKESQSYTFKNVSWDSYSLIINGKREFIYSGSYYYWRLPTPTLWKDVFEKIRAAGFNTITMYFNWDYHSPKSLIYDFSGIRDVEKFLTLTEEMGFYVIARPGPYINSDNNAGGFPGWLISLPGTTRSTNPYYTASWMQWLSVLNPYLYRHQITKGGNIIAVQVENEYSVGPLEPLYMEQLEAKYRLDGIDVPFSFNDAFAGDHWVHGPGHVQLYGIDAYPNGFNCTFPDVWGELPTYFEKDHHSFNPNEPEYLPEFQGGSTDYWGGPGFKKCTQMTNASFENVFYKNNLEQGASMFNIYVVYGGTSWGWLPYPGDYTSYDFGAAIAESRVLTEKYPQLKFLGYFLDCMEPFRKTNRTGVPVASNPNVHLALRENLETGTQFYFLRHENASAFTLESTHISIVENESSTYKSVPQEKNTYILLDGRDSKILTAFYQFGEQFLVYSTSEILTHGTMNSHDVLVVYAGKGQYGETVIRTKSKPAVTSSYSIKAFFNSSSGDLRLNYVHDGLQCIDVSYIDNRKKLKIFIVTTEKAASLWRGEVDGELILAEGPYLIRSFERKGEAIYIRGDVDKETEISLFTDVYHKNMFFNDERLVLSPTKCGGVKASIAGPPAISLPSLTNWKFKMGSPERFADFDDSRWRVADKYTTNSITPPVTYPVLYVDDYGFHFGDVWFRGHFIANGSEVGIKLDGVGGHRKGAFSAYSVWFNGEFLGSTYGNRTFYFPKSKLYIGKDNVISMLLENLGHEKDYPNDENEKRARGFIEASMVGYNATITWKIQGSCGGENVPDTVRGWLNNGGLYGERKGWYLPDYPDYDWKNVSLPYDFNEAAVAWFRTRFKLSIPSDIDVPIGLLIEDDPSYRYNALIFINGWMLGHYINYLGPQHDFVLHNGILNPNGWNDVAIAVWGQDAQGGRLGNVSLHAYQVLRTEPRVTEINYSPSYWEILPRLKQLC